MRAQLMRVGAPHDTLVPVFGSETLRTPDSLHDAERVEIRRALAGVVDQTVMGAAFAAGRAAPQAALAAARALPGR